MTASHGHDPCDDVLRRMYFFIDNELAEADSQQIQEHLDACVPCLRELDVERIVKALIARSCTERAPMELRQRVIFSIRHVQLELRNPGGPFAAGSNPTD